MPEADLLEQSPSSWLIQPLDEFYALAGLPTPLAREVSPNLVPEPYRALLVHERDMTSTLERFHHGSIRIRALRSHRREQFYFREVLLFVEEHQNIVEFGAIRIDLSLLPSGACTDILQERLPLGNILHQHGIAFSSHPKAFLKVWSDEVMNINLRLSAPQWLYGRRNSLLVPDGRSLAEIVEILPP